MQKQEFRNAVASAIGAGIIFLAGILALGITPSSGQMGKEQADQAMKEWVMKNPQVILDAVSEYQRTGARTQQTEALKKNTEFLFNDPTAPEAGNPKGDVTVVEFFDYNCGYCKHVLPVVQEVLEKDKNVRFVFKDFPILGPTSHTAAEWALAAHKQGKYFAFHSLMMAHKGQIDDAALEKAAAAAGMDVAQARKDAGSEEINAQIDRNLGLANSLGLNGTPAFIVGDQIMPGALSAEELQARIKQSRADAAAKKKD